MLNQSQAEQLLRAAGDGSSPALSKIHSMLRLQHERSEHSRQVCKPAPPRAVPKRVGPYPGAPKLLDVRPRPLEALSGNRKPPVLTQTNGFPFLRTRKPQSDFLSRVLRNKIEQKDRWFKRLDGVERDMEDGREEEEWERIVVRGVKREGGGNRRWVRDWVGDGGGWIEESVKARQEIHKLLKTDWKKTRVLGEKMTEVVEAEEKLFAQEKGGRKHEKNFARKERKRVMEEADTDRKS